MIEFVLGLVGAIVLAALGAMVGAQANASAPAIARWIVRRAVLRLPPELHERYAEEWLAVVEDMSGPLMKLWTAFGYLFAAPAILRDRTTEVVSSKTRIHRGRIKRAPGVRLNRLASFLFGSRRYMRVFQPLLVDMQVEYFEALKEGARSKARWVLVRGTSSFWMCVLLSVIAPRR